MLFGIPTNKQTYSVPKNLSKSKWSKGITHDGYHIRAGQIISIRENLLPPGCIGHMEKVSGVDKNGNAYSEYLASAWKGSPIPLIDCITRG